MQIEVAKKPVEVSFSKVAAIALTGVAPPAKPKGPYGRLVLANGGRLSLASARCTDGKVLEGKTTLGNELRIPVPDVAALDLFQGAAVYLSDLKAARYEHTPYLGVRWPYRTRQQRGGARPAPRRRCSRQRRVSGRGPTMLISPRNTFQSWGSSSRL